jgi:hypothetical protein
MRGGVAVAALLTVLVVVPSAGAGSPPRSIGASMTITASPNTVRVNTRLRVTLRYEMQCGYPGAGPLVVTFPAALKLPSRFAAGSVRLGGKTIAPKIHGRTVRVTIPPPTGTLCGTIGPGRVVLAFTRSARLMNPARAGSYSFRAAHGTHAFAAKLAIKPAP